MVKSKVKKASAPQTVKTNVRSATMSVNEKIARHISEIYHGSDDLGGSLVEIGDEFGMPIMAPRKKVNVLVIGNHSAGKSSLINWYVGEPIEKTGVALETQGFSIVTAGKKRDTLTGEATLRRYEELSGLRNVDRRIVKHVSTEVSTSRARKFPLVTFIDTPGLVDGQLEYPFDVNKGILWFADHADLIILTLDPIGQSLCRRTMDIVEQLNKDHHEKIRFYLSKADQIETEHDRQKVMVQITQNLSTRVRSKNFELPCIFVPELAEHEGRCQNAIESISDEIDRIISLNVQRNLADLEKHCDQLVDFIAGQRTVDLASREYNFQRSRMSWFLMVAIMPFMLLALLFLASILGLDTATLLSKAPNALHSTLQDTLTFLSQFEGSLLYGLGAVALLLLMLIFVFTVIRKFKKTLPRKRINQLKAAEEYITGVVVNMQKELYEEYFAQSVPRDET